MTQRQTILQVLRESGVWIKSFDLQKLKTKFGWLGTSADRQCRAMAMEGIIERRNVGKYAEYRTLTPVEFGQRKDNLSVTRRKKSREKREAQEEEGQLVL